MSRMYTATFEGVSVSAAQDFFELVAPADAVVRVHRIVISQDTSEVSEQAVIKLVRGEGSVTSGSGGTTPTARPASKGDSAFGGTVEANNTTKMVVGTGALMVLHREGWNFLSGFDFHPTPEERIDISHSDRLTVELVSDPSGATTMSGTIWFEEIGG
jgi:hypothetical protein